MLIFLNLNLCLLGFYICLRGATHSYTTYNIYPLFLTQIDIEEK